MKPARLIVAAFLGGVAGSAAREIVGLTTAAAGQPDLVARMLVNVVGGMLAGAYLALRTANSERPSRPPSMESLEPLLATGFLGGFTTVAGYAVDASRAIDSAAWLQLAILVTVDGAVGLLAAALGHRLARPRPTPAH